MAFYLEYLQDAGSAKTSRKINLFAEEEVKRYTYRAPGQANSYFYGYTKLIALRKETESQLGAKFDQKKFHDFILAQGLLPPDLMRKAVMDDFVPTQQTQSSH